MEQNGKYSDPILRITLKILMLDQPILFLHRNDPNQDLLYLLGNLDIPSNLVLASSLNLQTARCPEPPQDVLLEFTSFMLHSSRTFLQYNRNPCFYCFSQYSERLIHQKTALTHNFICHSIYFKCLTQAINIQVESIHYL